MTDEHLTRLWADAHHGFSADLDRGILKLDRFLRGKAQPATPIDQTYAPAAPTEGVANTRAQAALAGVTACLATAALLVTVALLATADVQPAHAYPLMTHTIVA